MADQIRSAELLVTTALASPDILEALKTKPEETLKNLSTEVTRQLPILPPPDTKTSNAIWLIVIIAFALVMVWAAYVIGAAVTSKLEQNAIYAAKSDTILTVFTTVVAFLAGLLSPSPLKK
jgi:divalent metal cation (Fe/Co/Zn/Cd) transporter